MDIFNTSVNVLSTSSRAEKQSICNSVDVTRIEKLGTPFMIVLASRSEIRGGVFLGVRHNLNDSVSSLHGKIVAVLPLRFARALLVNIR